MSGMVRQRASLLAARLPESRDALGQKVVWERMFGRGGRATATISDCWCSTLNPVGARGES